MRALRKRQQFSTPEDDWLVVDIEWGEGLGGGVLKSNSKERLFHCDLLRNIDSIEEIMCLPNSLPQDVASISVGGFKQGLKEVVVRHIQLAEWDLQVEVLGNKNGGGGGFHHHPLLEVPEAPVRNSVLD